MHFSKMLKTCYRTVVSIAIRSFTWGLYTDSGMSGAKAVLFHPASRAWSLQLLLLPAFSFWPSAVFAWSLELGTWSFQHSALFSSSTFGYFPVYSSGEQSN
jgi:hypothetical protein